MLKSILLICIGIIGLIQTLTVICHPFYVKRGKFKWFYHDIMVWHCPDEHSKFLLDGCSIHAKCKHCGKDIMQDSQGNWF